MRLFDRADLKKNEEGRITFFRICVRELIFPVRERMRKKIYGLPLKMTVQGDARSMMVVVVVHDLVVIRSALQNYTFLMM